MQNPNLPATAEHNRGNNLDPPQIGLHARPQAFKSQSSERRYPGVSLPATAERRSRLRRFGLHERWE